MKHCSIVQSTILTAYEYNLFQDLSSASDFIRFKVGLSSNSRADRAHNLSQHDTSMKFGRDTVSCTLSESKNGHEKYKDCFHFSRWQSFRHMLTLFASWRMYMLYTQQCTTNLRGLVWVYERKGQFILRAQTVRIRCVWGKIRFRMGVCFAQM